MDCSVDEKGLIMTFSAVCERNLLIYMRNKRGNNVNSLIMSTYSFEIFKKTALGSIWPQTTEW